MFRARLISGIVLVILALAVILTGGPVLAAVLTAISVIGMNELYRAVKVEDGRFSPLALVGYLGCIFYYILVFFGLTDSGYFVAYIPDGWDEIIFNTTGLDIQLDLEPEYGHLVLSY